MLSMTTTRSKVIRKTEGSYSVLYPRPKQIVTGLEPGDVQSFRELGSRRVYRMSIHTGFRVCVQMYASKITRRVKELRKAGVPLPKARRMAEKEVFS